MRLLALVCLLIPVASTAACVVGVDDTDRTGDDDPSAGTDGGEDPGPGPDADPGECEPAATALPNGNHNAGLACLQCHNGTTAPRWTLAGTLYTDRNGASPIAGATITILDAADVEHKLTSASNGNFYTTAAVEFPVRVTASKCPDSKSMTAGAQDGNCNGCHTAQSSQGRIHLP